MNPAEAALLAGHECVVLSALMNGADALRVCADDFSSPPNRVIFNRIISLRNRGLLAVTAALRRKKELEKVGGAARLTDIATLPHDRDSIEYALSEVVDASRKRQAAKIGKQLLASNITPQQARERLNEILAESETNLPRIQDAAEVIAQKIIVPDDVVESIAHRGGKVACGGASKSNKTWLLTDLGVSVATGTEWLGYATKKGRVLYVNFELPASFFAKRIQTICDERQLKLEPGMFCVLNLRGHVADWARLRQQIPPGEFALIILDPCYKLLLGRDENKAGDIASLMDEFEVLAVCSGAAVAFAAHYSKGNQASKESIDRIGGSGVFARDPDTILNFTRHEEPDCFTVEATLRNHPPIEPFVVRWEYPLFCVDATLDPSKLKKAGRSEKYSAKDLLALIDEPMSATQIVKTAYEELQIPRRRVFELLTDLKRGGLLKQPKKRGNYETA